MAFGVEASTREMHTDELRPGAHHVTPPPIISAKPDLGQQLRDLANRARRLPPPNHRNPHAFHEARSELGHELEQLADQVGGRTALQPVSGRIR